MLVSEVIVVERVLVMVLGSMCGGSGADSHYE